jgi:D-erythrulose 1-phosphate 3-epimerase
MTLLTLGINLGFATNRFPEPLEWARIVGEELGLHSVQLVADLLNPFWPDSVVEAEIARIQEAIGVYGISVHSLMTSTYTRVNHLLHPHAESREAWSAWFKRFADFASRLGAQAIGSHFGILSVRDVHDPDRYRERVADAVRRWQEISCYARDVGLQYVYFETMSIPRELGYTIAQAKELLERVNEHAGVPMTFCLDVGHAPHPDERDPYLWVSELGHQSRIVHLQQTEAGHSRHWPFTPTYNQAGIIDPARIIQTLCATRPDGQVLLAFEISHRESVEQDDLVVADLKASAQYWRRFLPADGHCPGE